MSGKRRLVIAMAAAGGLAGCASGDGVPISPGRFDGNMTLQSLSGVGLIPQKQEHIEYRPRSPLALPQKYDLKQPESPQVAARNPAWPKDPDAARRQKEREFEALSLEDYRRQRGVPHDSRQVLLTPEEMEKGRRAGGEPTGPVMDKRDHDVFLLPSEYNRKKTPEELEREKVDTTAPEPPRRYLTEPPTGYRAPVQAKTPEGQKAAEEALKARQGQKPERKGWGSWLGL